MQSAGRLFLPKFKFSNEREIHLKAKRRLWIIPEVFFPPLC